MTKNPRDSFDKKAKKPEETIETGMEVEATGGDLGEEDVSKPKVINMIQDQQGKVDKLVVKKDSLCQVFFGAIWNERKN